MQDLENYYNSISDYLKKKFGGKVIKLSIDGGFTCPNRDGTAGYGGCAFCSSEGSGEFSSDIDGQIELLSRKWPNAAGYIAYFQNHTNTYAPVPELREKFYGALENPKICGLAVSTRPDCISDEVADLLGEINEKHFLWVELGLQTIHPRTREAMNLCSGLSDFEEALRRLNERNIKTVVHVILGLPGESRNDMIETVSYLSDKKIFGIKLHLLNVVKGSPLYEQMPDYIPFGSMDDYISLVADIIGIIPPEVTIHRLTGDAKRSILVSPWWSYKKRTILNGIHAELKRRNIKQGGSI